ncbi:uncharacterized protein LOC8035375 [Ixodes scapularis]|uniref:uncharacterized protein LOC8035375 n=1 Tax=Ixodes scapularis TaxID=6945 RepID=UPI001A9F582A|nr:uncharacterized protein LOC8035375 [Ixodes scapularis]
MIQVILIATVLQALCHAESAAALGTPSARHEAVNFTVPQTSSVPEGGSTTKAVPKLPTTPAHNSVTVAENFRNATTSTTMRPSAETAPTFTTKVTRPEETTGKFMMPAVDALVAEDAASFSTSGADSAGQSSVPGAWSSSETSPAPTTSASTRSVVETSTTDRSAYDPLAELVRAFLHPELRTRTPDYEGDFGDSQMHQDAPFHTSDGEAVPLKSSRKDHHDDEVTSTAEAPAYDMSKERYCTAARYCYKELNERCITRRMRTVCGCGRAFVRNPETFTCERKLPLITSLELPHQSYVQEVADKKSGEFRRFESASQHLMWDLVLHSPMLWTWVTDIKVTGFRAGLLIRSKLVVPASFTSRFGRNVSATLHEQFQRSIAVNRTTAGSFLNITGIKLVAADIAVNPCEDADSNYCSPYSMCTYRKRTFNMTCRCLPGYEDVSPDIQGYAGELCFSICEPGFCQNNGTCKSTGFGVTCECGEWFVGNKCQYQMKQIIVIVVIIALVLLTVIAVTFHRFWKRGQIHKSNMVCRMLIIEPSKKRNRKFYELRLDSSSPFPSPGPAISPNHFSVPTKVAGSEILRNTSPILS